MGLFNCFFISIVSVLRGRSDVECNGHLRVSIRVGERPRPVAFWKGKLQTWYPVLYVTMTVLGHADWIFWIYFECLLEYIHMCNGCIWWTRRMCLLRLPPLPRNTEVWAPSPSGQPALFQVVSVTYVTHLVYLLYRHNSACLYLIGFQVYANPLSALIRHYHSYPGRRGPL